MVYLDTHVVVWLYAGELAKLSKTAKDLINENENETFKYFVGLVSIYNFSYWENKHN